MIDLGLKEFATEAQCKWIDAVAEHGSARKAAEVHGVNRRTIDQAIARAKFTAASRGYAPEHDMTRAAPQGYKVSGVSTLYNEGGEKKLQWVKTSIDQEERLNALQSAIDAINEGVSRLEPELDLPIHTDERLLNCFIITDYHIGMNAWGVETGADWDVHIAEELLARWFTAAIQQAPQAKTAIFAQLGDFLHWDGLDAVTSSGNILEGDTRKDKLVEVALRVSMRVISMLLKTHEKVHVLMAEGNHDMDGSVWLRNTFKLLYESEPRVSVDTTPQPYYVYEHGKTSLFFHHGHKRKPTNLDTVFAAKYREIWGRTIHSYGHVGHLHSDRMLEGNLMTIEQHRTLASPDSYATRGGWISGRSADVITYHDEYGQVGRASISPEMVKDAA